MVYTDPDIVDVEQSDRDDIIQRACEFALLNGDVKRVQSYTDNRLRSKLQRLENRIDNSIELPKRFGIKTIRVTLGVEFGFVAKVEFDADLDKFEAGHKKDVLH